MPEIEQSGNEPLELLYRNGEAATSGNVAIPTFRDISLTKESQALCEAVLLKAQTCDGPIRSESEMERYVAIHSLVDKRAHTLKQLQRNDREGWVYLLSQIGAAITPMLTQLQTWSGHIRRRVNERLALIEEGKQREAERLEELAQEKRNEAKYADNPETKRKASVRAKQLEKEAKKVQAESPPPKGVGLAQLLRVRVTNRALAVKLPEDAVEVNPVLNWFIRDIEAKQQAGIKITPHMYPGIELEFETIVRFHR